MTEMALEGIRVVDFGQAAVGAMLSRFLGDFGAEVIKMETSHRLEILRRLEPFKDDIRDADNSVAFAYINQNKMSVTLDVKRPEGLELAKRLVSMSDIVVENFTVGVTSRLGLSYEDLVKVKPDIIMISLSVAGQTGPYKHYRAHGPVLQAASGLQDLTGYPEGPPCAPGLFPTDFFLPYVGLTLVMAALWHRDSTGKGQYIDLSGFEAAVDLLDTAPMDYMVNGRILQRRGSRHPNYAPHGVYPCRGEDRWCAIAVKSDEEWDHFCQTLGNPPWSREERFSTKLMRLKHVAELDALIGEWTAERTAEEVMGSLQAAGVAAGAVHNSRDVCEDPQLQHRDFWWEAEEPELKPFTFGAPPGLLTGTPRRFRRPRPRLGEHNDYVFSELLGLSDEEIGRHMSEGTIE